MNKQYGFSMIEVLVSLLIIGVGLLGLSGLQIASTKGTINAHSRNIASMLAFDLSDRMRANQKGVDGGFYSNGVSCSSTLGKLCSTAYCSPKELASFDTKEVSCQIEELLTLGKLSVSCAGEGGCAARNAEHDITISWTEAKLHKDQSLNSVTDTSSVKTTANDTTKSITISVVP